MRSTPIQELETITGLEPLEDRRDTKMLVQAAKFKRLPNHPMRNRLAQPTKGRLRTGHNRLNDQVYTKLRIGQTDQCPCQTGSQTTTHLLQECPMHEELRHRIWTDETPVSRKLHGSLVDLRRTASFVQEAGVSI
ncbi:hypothetical protein C0Q70_03139 [Pomacea canaliculata]|uniref:Reverse transcriptase zinc-binding domain-containing protein n=1 Tax=Pomacea canaliculata TaxID=400727 RepID=A0A2T7PRW3_POMCA|nr:hypothetical protein C0Q70_03139 [Pomacea canaliculata]